MMKIGGTLSADMAVKLAIGAGVLIVGYVLYRKVSDAASSAAATVGDVVDKTVTAVNPASQDNLVNRGVTAVGQAATGDSSWSLGGWIYDITHKDPLTGQ